MKTFFSDTKRLKEAAKLEITNGLAHIKKWWVDKYKIPCNHPLFLDRSEAEHIQEMYLDMNIRKKELEQELEDVAYGDRRQEIMESLRNISNVLGDTDYIGKDDLIDRWEEQIANGEIPDLDETI